MSHSLFRMASRVYNTPHLITPDSLTPILEYFDKRNAHGFLMSGGGAEPQSMDGETEVVDNIGYLTVDGSLTYRPVMTMCGEVGTSYKTLVSQTEEMAAVGVKTIIMMVSSGGGEASHVFEAANDIRSICDENDIKLIGYADTRACSAAYALISVCDTVIANPSAEVGSIGCVVALMDVSKAMEQAGLKPIYISSGKSKVPFAEDGSFKPEFLQAVQEDVDRLNQEFAAHVSKYTGLDTQTIMDMEAKVYNADKALEVGLVNAVMTTKEFAQFVAQLEKGSQ